MRTANYVYEKAKFESFSFLFYLEGGWPSWWYPESLQRIFSHLFNKPPFLLGTPWSARKSKFCVHLIDFFWMKKNHQHKSKKCSCWIWWFQNYSYYGTKLSASFFIFEQKKLKIRGSLIFHSLSKYNFF